MTHPRSDKVHSTGFRGTKDNLDYFITRKAGIEGSWIGRYDDKHVFQARNGGWLVWWPSTQTLQLVGSWRQNEVAKIKGTISFLPHTPRRPVEFKPIPLGDINPEYLD